MLGPSYYSRRNKCPRTQVASLGDRYITECIIWRERDGRSEMLGSLLGDHHGAKKYLDGNWQDELETLSLSLGKKDGTADMLGSPCTSRKKAMVHQ